MFKLFKYNYLSKLFGGLPFSSGKLIANRNVNVLIEQNEHVRDAEDEVLEALYPTKAPVYTETRVLDFINRPHPSPLTSNIDQKKEIVIRCKNSKLNHYRNERHRKSESVPLASQGWLHYKSKRDYFSIKLCDDEDYIDSLFWDKTKTDFSSFRLNASLIKALKETGFTQPTKIQAKSIGALLSGKNCLITAETGCGKTLAYLIPVINQILNWTKYLPADRELNRPLALVLVPSRDLANQIGEVAVKLSYLLPFRCNVLVGGRTKRMMLNPQFEQIDLQVATPGALCKHVTTGLYDLSQVKHVVLDEGDTMLDDSFNDMLRRLLTKIKIRHGPPPGRDQLPTNSQISVVSATMPRNVYQALDSIVELNSLNEISTGKTHQILPHVFQMFYRLGSSQKQEKLIHLVKQSLSNNEKIIIFSNQTKTCNWISLMLKEKGVETVQLNAAMPESIRKHKFREFQDGQANVLSCTDIASRGLDTTQVRHIINYEFPKFMADYIHRCGRTGRVGSHSKCRISNFVSTDNDVKLVQKIEMAVRCMDSLPSVNGNISKIIQDRYDRLNNL